MLKTITKLSILALLAAPAGVALAQTGAPGDTGPTPQSPTSVPLDGGASLLLAGGVAYGLRRLRGRHRA